MIDPPNLLEFGFFKANLSFKIWRWFKSIRVGRFTVFVDMFFFGLKVGEDWKGALFLELLGPLGGINIWILKWPEHISDLELDTNFLVMSWE